MTQIDDIIESFSLTDDWETRYAILIDLGKRLPPMPNFLKTDENLVKGCVSKVWMVMQVNDGILTFQADSDAHIVKGLVALLYIMFNNTPLSAIKSVDIEAVFTQLGLDQNLSPNRRNGFFAMVGKIHSLSSIN